MAVGGAFAPEAKRIDGALFTNARDHILENAPFLDMVENVVYRDGRYLRGSRQIR